MRRVQRSWWDDRPELREFVARMIGDLANYQKIQAACAERFGADNVPSQARISKLRMALAAGRYPRPGAEIAEQASFEPKRTPAQPKPEPEPLPEAAQTAQTAAPEHIPDIGKMIEPAPEPTPVPEPAPAAESPFTHNELIEVLGYWLLNPNVTTAALDVLPDSVSELVFTSIVDVECRKRGVRAPSAAERAALIGIMCRAERENWPGHWKRPTCKPPKLPTPRRARDAPPVGIRDPRIAELMALDRVDCRIPGITRLNGYQCLRRQMGAKQRTIKHWGSDGTMINPRYQKCVGCPHFLDEEQYTALHKDVRAGLQLRPGGAAT